MVSQSCIPYIQGQLNAWHASQLGLRRLHLIYSTLLAHSPRHRVPNLQSLPAYLPLATALAIHRLLGLIARPPDGQAINANLWALLHRHMGTVAMTWSRNGRHLVAHGGIVVVYIVSRAGNETSKPVQYPRFEAAHHYTSTTTIWEGLPSPFERHTTTHTGRRRLGTEL